MRIVVFGNSGSGKTTLSKRLAEKHRLPHLDLDGLAWDPGPKRRPLQRSAAEIEEFLEEKSGWIVEGCYGDLIELVLPRATEVVFLNPGTQVCLTNCRARPWEPTKYASPEDQDRNLEMLLGWVQEYETRTDEFSLRRHRTIFESYPGNKREVNDLAELDDGS